MIEKEKISNRQVILLVNVFISSTAIIYLPTVVYNEAKQDGWMTFILFGLMGIIVASIVTSLGIMFKDKTIVEYSEVILGKIPGKVIGLILFLFFISINAIIIREFCELLITSYSSNTPAHFFSIAIIILSIYALYSGIEVIARTNEIIFPLFAIAILSIVFLSIREMDFKNLTPILAEGFIPVLKGFYAQILFASEIFILSMLMPYINEPEKVRRSSIITMTIITGLAILITIGMVAVLGDEIGHLHYPFLTFARYVNVRNVFERIESLVIALWVAGVFIKIALYHYCGVMVFAQVFHFKNYKKLIIPMGVLLVFLSQIIFKNDAQFYELIHHGIKFPFTCIQVGIPIFLLIIAKVRKKAIKKKTG
ncbi:MAG: endospore germination permease [Peptostreptococcales bacterium]|jgi:spore germination protein KB